MTTGGSYDSKIATGISGLDEVLCGGLPIDGIYLLQGNPGVGKTTFGLQFLLEGARRGERVLYVSFSETRPELQAVAKSHGWDLGPIRLYDLSGSEHHSRRDNVGQTMFHPSEVELEEATRPLLEEIARAKPSRIVIDSVSEFRLLARDPLRYRKQLLSLKQFFLEHRCTVILVDDKVAMRDDDVINTVVHGIVALDKQTPVYGTTRRRLAIEKLRGVHYREGLHDYRIDTGGISVFPRLSATPPQSAFTAVKLSSGMAQLDALLAGGLDRGTSTLLMGSAGTGKSSLAAQYSIAAAARGERAAVFAYEESIATWLARERAFGTDPQKYIDSGHLTIIQVDPAELSPGELAAKVVELVNRQKLSVLVIDSLNGYLQSVPGENFLLLHMHEMLSYLGHQGVSTIMVMAQNGILGPSMQSPVDASYLADTVMLLRYFESAGSVRQVISVLKKRSGGHERTLREFAVTNRGVWVGDPLTDFHGVLTGVPTYLGNPTKAK